LGTRATNVGYKSGGLEVRALTVGVLMLISACYFAKDEGKKKIEEEGNVDRCP
jgi:hypothetical protein